MSSPSLPVATAVPTRDQPRGHAARAAAWIERHELAVVTTLALLLVLPGLGAFQLIDCWETHYAEVARAILKDDDWVRLTWQDEAFRSKPVLTFWLIAASMAAFGVATDGGYAGELVSRDVTMLAVRLPFALFGALGLVMVWWMLRRLVSRRVAWLAFAIIGTTPFYLLVARQAITDIPMVAAVMGAMALFAVTIHQGDAALRVRRWRLHAGHLFLACLGAFVLWQAGTHAVYFAHGGLARGLAIPAPGWILGGATAGLFLALLAWCLLLQPLRTSGQVMMLWFYLLVGIGVLAKGPLGLLPGLFCFLFILLSGRWRLLLRLEIPRGVLVTCLVALPWHVAMWFKDGRGWVNEYIVHHMLRRVASGVHGERGTFDYFSSQIGVGMWPWAALLPAALVAVLFADRRARDAQVRLLVGVWAIAGFAFFAMSQTKFHHYILPVVPAFAILIAFWLDDLLAGRVRRPTLLLLLGALLALMVTRDLLGEPKQLIEMFVYRYDRPWPGGKPWFVDVSGPVLGLGLAGGAALGWLAFAGRRTLRWAIAALGAVAFCFAMWSAHGYMAVAAPHWGQRELHRQYYARRAIHGAEIKYSSLRDLADQWGGGGAGSLRLESLLPDGFAAGLPMTVRLLVPGAGVPKDQVELAGKVSHVGRDEFWIEVPAAEIKQKLATLIERGRKQQPARRRPWVHVDADRLIAWQLNWRGENFWSSGEIYGETADTRTVFINTNNEEFLKYVKDEARRGRRFFVITEAQRAGGLKSILPTPKAKETVEVIDTSCNKFTLLQFVL